MEYCIAASSASLLTLLIRHGSFAGAGCENGQLLALHGFWFDNTTLGFASLPRIENMHVSLNNASCPTTDTTEAPPSSLVIRFETNASYEVPPLRVLSLPDLLGVGTGAVVLPCPYPDGCLTDCHGFPVCNDGYEGCVVRTLRVFNASSS